MAGIAGGGGFLSKISGLFSFGGGDRLIGLNIGSSSVKLVELKKRGKSFDLLHFGIVDLPEGAISNREITNPIAVIESIKSLAKQMSLGNKNVCTSMGGTSIVTKRMSVQVEKMSELQDQVFWEAEQYLPFDVSEVVMDFHVLGKAPDGQIDLILVAAKQSVVDSYMGVIEDSGLKPKVVDVEFYALQTLFEASYNATSGESVALVDIGANALKIVIVQGGVPLFTKDTAIGGRNLTSEIQKHLNLSFEDAEALKVGAAGGTPQEVNEIVHLMCENFAAEIKRSLDFYGASSSGPPVSNILVAGGCARIGELPRVVEEVTGLPCQTMNPFNAIGYDSGAFNPEYLASIAPIAAVPLGLAIRLGAG